MFWYNRWDLTGRLVRDPAPPRFLPDGTAQLEFTIAHNRPLGKGSEPHVAYVDIVVRGRQAEACAEHLRKGSPVMCSGESWSAPYIYDGRPTKYKRIIMKARLVLFLNLAVDIPAADEPSGVEVPE